MLDDFDDDPAYYNPEGYPPVLGGSAVEINVTIADVESIDLSTIVGDRGTTLGELVAGKLAKLMYEGDNHLEDLRREVRAARGAVLVEQVTPIIEEALSGTMRLTNSYGEPSGPEVTLRELIISETKKILVGGRDNSGRGKTLIQRLILEEVNVAFKNELKAEIQSQKADAMDAVRAVVVDALTAKIVTLK